MIPSDFLQLFFTIVFSGAFFEDIILSDWEGSLVIPSDFLQLFFFEAFFEDDIFWEGSLVSGTRSITTHSSLFPCHLKIWTTGTGFRFSSP